MSFTFKFHGKKFSTNPVQGWTFKIRPGGWMIAYPPAGSSESLKPVRLSFWGKKGRVSLSSGGVLWSGELSQQRQTLSSSGQASSDADLVAQFPGKIRKILVKKGDQVAESDPLILVEAMKMEFAIKAPFNGVVLRLLVEEGQQISPGARFLDLEEKRG